MQLTDFIKNKNFSNSLPQGYTIINILTAQVIEETRKSDDGTTRNVFELTLDDGQKLIVPKSVMADIKNRIIQGANKVRITRVGTTKLDTKYTVVTI